MRRNEKEIKDVKDIEQVLVDSRVCRIAMVDEGMPYVVPMNFGYKDRCLYLHSAPKGKKIDMMKKNSAVCFEADQMVRLKKAGQACEWGAEYKSVIGWGKALFLEGMDEKKKALDIIMAHYSERSFEYTEESLEKIAVIKIRIEKMTGKQS